MDISQRLANLSPEQRELLKRRLKQKRRSQGESADRIPPRETDRALPLSFAQQRLWFLDRLEPDSPAYNLAAKVNLEGPLNVTALEQTINAVIQRHEVWRTNFTANEQGQPRQIIASTRTIPLPLLDLGPLSPYQQEREVSRLATQQAKTPFDLEQGPLLRATLLRLNPNQHIMVFTMHHIVSDGWSLGVLLQEVAKLYEAFCQGRSSPLPALPIQYADYAIWQRQQLQDGKLDAQLAYWKHQLADPPVLQLPTDYSRPPIQTFRGVREPVEIPQSLVDALSRFSQQEGVTLFMTLLAALKVLLYRYTGQSDLIVGSPVAGRDRAEVEGLIGCFVNMLVFRTDASGDPSFRTFLKRVQQVTLDAYSHQAVPFEKLVEELQLERELNRNPLYQVSLTLNNVPMPTSELSDLKLDLEEIDNETTKLDLSLDLYPVADGLSGWFEYSTDLFYPDTIHRMVGHWQTLLQGIVADPERRISELPLLTSSEQQKILREWNQTQTHDWPQQCLHEVVEAQAECTPDAIAASFENEQLSYGELNQRANQLAHCLQDLGVGPETLVGIYIERSLEMAIGLLGILKAGGAYLPLDPNYPQERISFMLRDAETPIVLTQKRLISQLPEHDAKLLAVDRDWHIISQQPANRLNVSLDPDNLAYTIYTSGSTGRPKGVQISHRALMNFLSAMERELNIAAEDAFMALTPLSFDIAGLELWLPLTLGGKTVVIAREATRDGQQLSRQLAQAEASVMQATPASWELLLQAGWQGNQSLKLLCGGEALSPNLAQKLAARSGQLWNVYGPTETTVWSTAQPIQQEDRWIFIGYPILNTEVYVLDSHFQPVPIGVPGELYLGGTGLSRGYLNRSELTAEKFVPHPYTQQPGKRLYRTGDLVRYHSDGCLEYLGRIDNQIKLRGFRIELEELEKTLTEHPAVAQSVAAKKADRSNHQQLVAYVVPEQPAQQNTESATPIPAFSEETVESQSLQNEQLGNQLASQLRGYLKDRLPNYMVPSVIALLNGLPLTANGKVDRNALPAPALAHDNQEFTPPETAAERTLATIWQQVLGLEQVGIHDNFFELGGDSLMSMQVVAKAKQAQLQLTPKQLFECQTIAELAAIAEQGQVEESNEAAIAASFPLLQLDQATLDTLKATYPTLEDIYPLSPIQQGILFHALYASDTEVYFEQWQCTLQGDLDRAAFQQAWERVISRHPILRTSFHWEQLDDPVQIVHQQAELPWREQNWQHLSASEQSEQLTAFEERDRALGFNLSQAPLMRLSLIQTAEQTYQFIWSHHHLIIDGWSSAAILKEVFDCYQAFRQGSEPNLTAPPPYRNYIRWLQQQDFAEARAFWQDQLRGFTAPTSLNRLTAGKSRQGETVGSQKQEVSLSQQQFRDLQLLAQTSQITLNAMFQGAWALLLSRYSGDRDVVFGTTVSGRPPDLAGSDSMIGVFINTLPVRAFVSSQNTLLPWLKQLQEQQATLNQYQCSPLADIHRWSDVPSETSLFETILVFQNYPIDESLLEPTNNDLTFDNVRSVTRNNYPLTLRVTPLNGILLQAIYDPNRFDPSAIAQLLQELKTLLQIMLDSSGSQLGDLLQQLADKEKQQQAQQQQALKQSRRQKLGQIGRRSIKNR